MPTPRHPTRLTVYTSNGTYYHRELVESDGLLYLINQDGSTTILNKTSVTSIKDASGADIGTIDPVDGSTVTIPNASTTKRGLVVFGTNTGSAAGTASAGTADSVARADHVHPLQEASYGITDSSSTAGAFKVTVPNLLSLQQGAVIFIRFTRANSSNATINVNSLGAKPIYYNGSPIDSQRCLANSVIGFIYDTTLVSTGAWLYLYAYNSTYSNAVLGQGYGTCSTEGSVSTKAVTLSNYALAVGGVITVYFTNNVGANSKLNVNSKGAKSIFSGTSAITDGVIKAGDTASFIYDGSNYYLLSVQNADGISLVARSGSYSDLLCTMLQMKVN